MEWINASMRNPEVVNSWSDAFFCKAKGIKYVGYFVNNEWRIRLHINGEQTRAIPKSWLSDWFWLEDS